MVWHEEEEDDIAWNLTPGYETNTFNDMMIRLAMPSQDNWTWQATSTPRQLQHSYESQLQHTPVPIQRTSVSDALSFGISSSTPQWPVQLQGSNYQQHQADPLHGHASHQRTTSSNDTLAVHPPLAIPWPDVFASTRALQHEPPLDSQQAQRKAKRSADDLYTPHWVRKHGTHREGWCGWCRTWYTLRDSAYWYHMHYSHGIAQVDGKRLPAPTGYQFTESAEWEVKCGKCNKWMALPPGDRWNTAYFRHTYKCYYKGKAEQQEEHTSPIQRQYSGML